MIYDISHGTHYVYFDVISKKILHFRSEAPLQVTLYVCLSVLGPNLCMYVQYMQYMYAEQ